MSDRARIKRSKGKARPKRKAHAARKADWLEKLPFDGATVERWVGRAIVATVIVAVIGIGWIGNVHGLIGTEMAKAAGRAGFAVKRVEVTGVDRMDRLTVYGIVLDQHSMAMPLVDLGKIRWKLRQFPWIEDARVSRRLPDTLVVDIVERRPAAIWQLNRKLSLIDVTGKVIERVDPRAIPNLPILLGLDADKDLRAKKIREFLAIMDYAPALQRRVASAERVGDRRWDIRFDSGEVLALPENERDAAGRAFLRFSRINGVERLLGRDFAWFDMRDPKQMRIRKAAAARPEPATDTKPDEAPKTKREARATTKGEA